MTIILRSLKKNPQNLDNKRKQGDSFKNSWLSERFDFTSIKNKTHFVYLTEQKGKRRNCGPCEGKGGLLVAPEMKLARPRRSSARQGRSQPQGGCSGVRAAFARAVLTKQREPAQGWPSSTQRRATPQTPTYGRGATAHAATCSS